MAQKAKCLTRKINHVRKQQATGMAVHVKKVRRNIKIRCVRKLHGEKLSRNWNL